MAKFTKLATLFVSLDNASTVSCFDAKVYDLAAVVRTDGQILFLLSLSSSFSLEFISSFPLFYYICFLHMSILFLNFTLSLECVYVLSKYVLIFFRTQLRSFSCHFICLLLSPSGSHILLSGPHFKIHEFLIVKYIYIFFFYKEL